MNYIDASRIKNYKTVSDIYLAARSTLKSIFIPCRSFALNMQIPSVLVQRMGLVLEQVFSRILSALTAHHLYSWAVSTVSRWKHLYIWLIVASSVDRLAESIFWWVILVVVLARLFNKQNERKRLGASRRACDTHGFTTVGQEREVDGDKFDPNFRAVLPFNSGESP